MIHLKVLISSVYVRCVHVNMLPSLFTHCFSFHSCLLFSSALLSSLLRPARCATHQMLRKQRLLLSAGAGRSCQSLQLCLMIAFQMTLLSSLHCLFFLYDEIQLERHATGHIIKMWLKRKEPRSSLETTHDNFCHTGIKNTTGYVA